jgi:hypothetical protein
MSFVDRQWSLADRLSTQVTTELTEETDLTPHRQLSNVSRDVPRRENSDRTRHVKDDLMRPIIWSPLFFSLRACEPDVIVHQR